MLRASSRSNHPGMRPTTLSMVSTWRPLRIPSSRPPPLPSLGFAALLCGRAPSMLRLGSGGTP
eukprot:14321079-Alexandrium_andersonii.AAC.1